MTDLPNIRIGIIAIDTQYGRIIAFYRILVKNAAGRAQGHPAAFL